MSGVGKTTLGNKLTSKIKNSIQVDGDLIRKNLSPSLDYKVESRIKQIIKIRNLVHSTYQQGMIVIVSALYSNPKLLYENRLFFTNYTEVYLRSDIEKLIERDSKGLYSKFLSGEIKDVVGMDIKWIEPKAPDFVFDNTVFHSCEVMAYKIMKGVNL